MKELEEMVLDDGILINREAYLKIENHIASLMEEIGDMEEALWTALVDIGMLSMIARMRGFSRLDLQEVTRILDVEAGYSFVRDETFQQLALFYTLTVVGILEASPAHEPRQITQAALEGGSFRSGTFGKEISMTTFSAYCLKNRCPWKGAFQKRFMEHLLFRKFLVGSEPLLHNLAALFTAYGLLEFYFYFGAYCRGKETPDMDDLHGASGIVEQGFSAHTTEMTPFFKSFSLGFKDQLQLKMDWEDN